MLRLADRHHDRALVRRRRDPREQRAQALERIRGQEIETRIHGRGGRSEARDYSGAGSRGGILVGLANLVAFAALAAVVAYWGWRWFGPSPVHIPSAPVTDLATAFAVSPPFGAASGNAGATTPAAPSMLGGDTRLLGVLSEPDGRGRALFRFADGSARLVAAGDALSANATLVAVRPDGVTIRDAGGERSIALRAQPPAAPTTRRAAISAACALPPGFKGPVVRLAAELVQGLIAQPEALRSLADAQGNALVIRDESGLAAMLGMKKGDRVLQANGIALRAPEDVIVAVLRPLAASQPVRLVGMRDNASREMVILNASVCPG